MDQRIVIETPLMRTTRRPPGRAQQLGCNALVELVRTDTHSGQVGDRGTLHA